MASSLDLRKVLTALRRESLPAPAPPPVDPAHVRRTLRAAARSRRRPSWLTVTANCGGPGSGRPGPCPDSKEIPEGIKKMAIHLRRALKKRCDDTTGQCLTAVAALRDIVPEVEIYSGTYQGSRGKGGHYIAKKDEWFIDVTADQFGDSPIRVFHESKVPKSYKQLGGFSKSGDTEGSFDEYSHSLRSRIAKSLHRRLSPTANASNVGRVLNCGGPGSGKPGPCPKLDRKTSRYEILPLDEEESHVEAYLDAFGGDARLLDGIRNVDLSEIDQPSERGDKYRADVRKLAERIAKSRSIRPIVVVRERKGTYTLDGDHRVSAFKILGEKSIPAVVIERSEMTRNVAGRGQFSSQRSPWRVTIRRLAPYLLDLMPDLTKVQAAGIARSIQLGLRSDASDGEVAEMIEEYGIEPERAALIARTEMARARADTELGNLRPNERVVYVLAPDACPKCVKVKRKYRERRLTAKQAQGIIPVHPNCYCRWKTVNAKSGREVTRNAEGTDVAILEYSRLVENCGGPGSGRPGPCPSGKKWTATKTPFRTATHDEIAEVGKATQDSGLGIFDAKEEAVPLSSIVGTQAKLWPKRVQAYIDNPDRASDAVPTATKYRGAYYLSEGHHRASAAVARGEKAMKMRVFDLDAVRKS